MSFSFGIPKDKQKEPSITTYSFQFGASEEDKSEDKQNTSSESANEILNKSAPPLLSATNTINPGATATEEGKTSTLFGSLTIQNSTPVNGPTTAGQTQGFGSTGIFGAPFVIASNQTPGNTNGGETTIFGNGPISSGSTQTQGFGSASGIFGTSNFETSQTQGNTFVCSTNGQPAALGSGPSNSGAAQTQGFGAGQTQRFGENSGIFGTSNFETSQAQGNTFGCSTNGQPAAFGSGPSNSGAAQTQGFGAGQTQRFGENSGGIFGGLVGRNMLKSMPSFNSQTKTSILGATNITVNGPITITGHEQQNDFKFGINPYNNPNFSYNAPNQTSTITGTIGSTNIKVVQPITITDYDEKIGFKYTPAPQFMFNKPPPKVNENVGTTNITVYRPISISACDVPKYFPNGVPNIPPNFIYHGAPTNYSNTIGKLSSTTITVEQPITIKGKEQNFRFGILPTTTQRQSLFKTNYTNTTVNNDDSVGTTNITVDKPITIRGRRSST